MDRSNDVRAPRRIGPVGWLLLGVLGATACGDSEGGPEPDSGSLVTVREGGANQGEAGQIDPPPATRRLRRMTADQYLKSLAVATGVQVPNFEKEYAGFMGRPNLRDRVEEDRSYSLAFEKFARDAAELYCRRAVQADRGRTDASERTVVRLVDFEETEPALLERNLRYLMRRFLTMDVPEGDPRLQPWLRLLTRELDAVGEDRLAGEMAYRWRAVCMGLALHPDFVYY